ncbi:MAG: small multidrug resistance protein [Polyangiaceae bacterium]|nr:small multidrug resistance protein [Polyangiaceae bacterium]
MSASRAWALLLGAGMTSCAANLLLKRARMGAEGGGLPELVRSPWLLAGLALHAANAFCFTKALGVLPVSAAYPALAGWSFLLLALSARVLLGERLDAQQWVGVALILAGIIVSARAR